MPVRTLATPFAPPLCWSCGKLAGRSEPLCRGCRRGLPWVGAEPVRIAGLLAWAPLAYAGPARELVGALKFRGAAGLADAMAAQLVASAPIGLFDERRCLVPVPLHRARRRGRGFNQTERLARALGRRTGLAVSDCLERGGPARTQMGRSRDERLAAVGRQVRVARAPPERALLVDDVITTGATLAACASALRSAGSRTVAAIAYARTPGR